MSDFLSERARTLPYSGIREVFDLAGTMDGVIHLEIGEPDFKTPPSIVKASFRAAAAGMTHYTSSAGVPELRARIAERTGLRTRHPVRSSRGYRHGGRDGGAPPGHARHSRPGG